MKDKKTISNQPHEIAAAAKSMGVEQISIYLAKHETKSNNREVIKEWIEKWRGSSVGVII
jgi:DNA invertase Pin-like site-specific DNA recombinase